MKERAGLELKIRVVPKDWTRKRWLRGRGILEQPCRRGRIAGLSHLASGGSRWASGARKALCREAVCSADTRGSALRLGGQQLLSLLGPSVFLASESL